jgi:UDP-GlcNAc:undecaprenyl-phosphate/decaprenyl-phosphate GlcNAc-1-phosphate transferase
MNRRSTLGRHPSVVRLLAAGTGARLAYAALTRMPPGGPKTWTRTNHRGEPVTLLEGPAASLAAVTSALAAAEPGEGQGRLAIAVAGLGAGAVGCYDDLAGTGGRRGFRGHLGALAKGEVTTGAVKILGVGAAGLTAAFLLDRRGSGGGQGVKRVDSTVAGRIADVAINAGLIAGAANLVNLFDLRPGRAIKVSLLACAALAATGAKGRANVAAPAGAALALLPEDLGERAMLGDSGANAIGAMLGVAAASSLPRPARLGVLAGIVGLTAASEKVSFTKVIARTPALNWLDMLGRRPVPAPASAGDPASRPEGGEPLAQHDSGQHDSGQHDSGRLDAGRNDGGRRHPVEDSTGQHVSSPGQ